MSVPEQWASVPDHPGYLASTLGRIASTKSGQPRVLRQYSHPDGHQFVCPYIGGRRTNRYVHRLVLLAFVGKRPVGKESRHIDGDPRNNALTNLVYGNHSENMRDRIRHGRDTNLQHTRCPSGHPFDNANTYRMPSEGYRRCRACRADSKRRSRQRMAASRR